MDNLKMSKCLIEILTTQERCKTYTCALSFLTDSVCVGSSDPCWKLLHRSDRGSSASRFNSIGSSDNHITSTLTANFWGSRRCSSWVRSAAQEGGASVRARVRCVT
jgi:hypothetical protein